MDEITRTERIIEAFLSSGKLQDLGITAVKLIILIVICFGFLKLILKITRKALDKSSLDSVLYSFIINSIKVAGGIIIVTMCLSIIGVQISTIITVVGAAGAAIALALKDSLANVAGGVMIIVTKPFKKDDVIDIGEVSGKVKDIDLFLTTLRTFDNKTITIPNGIINTSVLINHSREGVRRVDCKFGIGYKCDISKVKQILQEICDENEMILKDPEPVIGVSEHGQNAVIMDLMAWCDTDDYYTVKYYLEEKAKEVFDDNGIEIPYPQMDVHIQKK